MCSAVDFLAGCGTEMVKTTTHQSMANDGLDPDDWMHRVQSHTRPTHQFPVETQIHTFPEGHALTHYRNVIGASLYAITR